MAKAKYVAQNRIVGLAKKDVELGETVELEMEAAAPFVAGGSLVMTAPPDPPKDPPAK